MLLLTDANDDQKRKLYPTLSGAQRAHESKIYYMPLNFWIDRSPNLSFPYIYIPHTTIQKFEAMFERILIPVAVINKYAYSTRFRK